MSLGMPADLLLRRKRGPWPRKTLRVRRYLSGLALFGFLNAHLLPFVAGLQKTELVGLTLGCSPLKRHLV